MGRLIDGDSFEAGIKILFGESNPIIHMVINKLHDQPTVEAISKADYENRLKADMVAMLEELRLEFEEYEPKWVENEDQAIASNRTWDDFDDVIQQKIKKLKES